MGNNEETKKLLKRINGSENYLKARFRTHCMNDDSCSSHCINHALSHPNDKQLFSKCDKTHDSICSECLTIIESIALLKLKLTHLPDDHKKDVADVCLLMCADFSRN